MVHSAIRMYYIILKEQQHGVVEKEHDQEKGGMRSTEHKIGAGHTEQQKDQCQVEEHEGGRRRRCYHKL